MKYFQNHFKSYSNFTELREIDQLIGATNEVTLEALRSALEIGHWFK